MTTCKNSLAVWRRRGGRQGGRRHPSQNLAWGLKALKWTTTAPSSVHRPSVFCWLGASAIRRFTSQFARLCKPRLSAAALQQLQMRAGAAGSALAQQAGNAILEGPPPRPTVWGGRVCSRGARVWGDCRLTVTAERGRKGGRGRHRREQRRWRRRQRASGSRVQRSVRSTPQLRPILRLACH